LVVNHCACIVDKPKQNPASLCVCSFWFRFVRVWQTVRVTPLETYRAVSVTSSAAKDVVSEMVNDSVQQALHAVDEARAVADRSRAKAELMEDRPCPDVSAHHGPCCKVCWHHCVGKQCSMQDDSTLCNVCNVKHVVLHP